MGLITRVGELADCLFERHKFVRRAAIFWMFSLVTHAHYVVYGLVEKLDTLDGVVAIYTLDMGLVTILTAWYLQLRYHEDKPK